MKRYMDISCDWETVLPTVSIKKIKKTNSNCKKDKEKQHGITREKGEHEGYKKSCISHSALPIKAKSVYKMIMAICETDKQVLRVNDMIKNGPIKNVKISGRIIDTLVTRSHKFIDTCYYIDVTDRWAPFIVDDVVDITRDDRNIILFDVCSSYRQKMLQFSKGYFDCFGRGYVVSHILKSGKTVPINLCQFNFFLWAKQYCVFEFLIRQYEKIVRIRRMFQANKFTCVVETDKSKCTMLSPKLQHEDIIRSEYNSHIGCIYDCGRSNACEVKGECKPIDAYFKR